MRVFWLFPGFAFFTREGEYADDHYYMLNWHRNECAWIIPGTLRYEDFAT